ncbi:MAG: sugar transferase [Agathobacter sp.]|nr:sugar transferase [Agathobacter sp.]
MKKQLAKFISTIVLLIKAALYGSLLGTFIMMFSINPSNFALLVPSRTLAVVMVAFVLALLTMTRIYGKFDIGRRKSKPIIYSVFLATMITDIVAYGMVVIMKTIEPDMNPFQWMDVLLLLAVLGVHLLIITIFAYVGNEIFFLIIPPERCIIITKWNSDLEKISAGLQKYKKQYRVTRVVDYRRTDLEDILIKMDTAILYDLPLETRDYLVNFCYEHLINIYLNPEIPDVVENLAEHYLLDDVSMLHTQVQGLTYEQRFIKRTFDIVFSALAIIVLLPVFVVVAVLIRMDDGGPVFFLQQRATRDGKIFKVVKFRTMKVHSKNKSATVNDDRITKIGHKLRKYRIDELPQIFNIFMGDMSFVGPRPEMLENVWSYTEEMPEFKYRLRVKAGLTGLAQVVGKYNTSPKDKLILDMMYIERFSIWRDIKLIFQTLIVFLKKDSTEGFDKKHKKIYVVEETPHEYRIKE